MGMDEPKAKKQPTFRKIRKMPEYLTKNKIDNLYSFFCTNLGCVLRPMAYYGFWTKIKLDISC